MIRLSLLEAASEAGEQVALITAQRTLTYSQLAARVQLAAGFLFAQGIAPNRSQPVALVMHPELETIELFWALFALGRPVVLLHPRQGAEARQGVVRRCNAVLVEAATWRERAATQTVRRPWSDADRQPEGIRVIAPTSGTSGQPKLVRLSERALLASARANWENLGVRPEERWLICLPLAHVGGLSILTRSLYARRAAVLFEGDGGPLSRLAELAQTIDRTRTTLLSLVPTVLDALLEQGFAPSSKLRALLLGGAAANVRLLERAEQAGLPVLTSYGLTEAASQVTTRPYAERFRALPLRSGLPSSGEPLHGVRLRISGDSLIEVAGPMLHSGYFDEPTPMTEDGYFRTGDRGLLTAAGLIVMGRADDLIVSGGENVDPLVVEAALLRLPGLTAACVFAVEDERWGQLVGAAVCVGDAGPSRAKVARFCVDHLAAHERPRLLAVLPELARTAAGKLDRAATARLAQSALAPLSS